MRKVIYGVVAVLLVPAVSAFFYTIVVLIFGSGDLLQRMIYFFFGTISYLVFFLAFKKPITTYVFGHELTHVLWVLLFRGKIDSMKISKKGGYIRANRKNFLILLAPYFFPLYTLLTILAYIIVSYFHNIDRYFPIVAFAVGFTWSFHILLNALAISRTQDDFQHTGGFFSLVIVILLNIFILGLLTTFISGTVTLHDNFAALKENIPAAYLVVIRGIRNFGNFINKATS